MLKILGALRPALMTTKGPLLIASSAYAKIGVLYESYKKYLVPTGRPMFWSVMAHRVISIRHCRRPRSNASLSATRCAIALSI